MATRWAMTSTASVAVLSVLAQRAIWLGLLPMRAICRVRVTIGFSPDMYGTLERIARDKKVSLAWVVRDAMDTYVAEKWPLLFKSLG